MAKLLWTQRQNIGPLPRHGHAMAYDAARKHVVMFGGSGVNGGGFDDTWIWDGENWTQVADIGPSARTGHAMAYDQARGRVVLFGGQVPGGRVGDTWEWDGEEWTQVANVGPARRAEHALAYHTGRQRVTLFGGGDVAVMGDTWEWDGDEWTQQEDSGPAPRIGHALTSDVVRGRLLLFGGTVGNAGEVFGDTWEWDGGEWTQVAAFGPEPAMDAAMVFKNTRVALFGGAGVADAPNAAPRFHVTWEWDGKRWTLRQDIGPRARDRHAMAFDAARSRVVLFGGRSLAGAPPAQEVFGDTWEHLDQSIGVAPPPDPDAPLPPDAGPGFDFSVQPPGVTFHGAAAADFVVPFSNVETLVTLTYTAAVLQGLPTFLASVHIPAGTTNFQRGLPLQQMQMALMANGFAPPADITITATVDEISRSATLRITSV